MSDGDTINVAWLATGLGLVVSALVTRRLSGEVWLRMAATWAGIFAAAWLVVLLLSHIVDLSHFT